VLFFFFGHKFKGGPAQPPTFCCRDLMLLLFLPFLYLEDVL
jgi:hypothetical protein